MSVESVCSIAAVCLVSLLFRWIVGLSPYSGEGKPPLFGDYEAQRHWMEVTYSLPVADWYNETERNQLQYWGLDYPPLTAYHSLLLGLISVRLNSSWVELYVSRGIESQAHKLFMRASVLCADLCTYMPAAAVYVWATHTQRSTTFLHKSTLLALHLLYPGFLLIDYAHFQYNCVSLGLCLAAVAALTLNHNLVGSTLFVAALNYKQMELYHSLPFFCYLLSNCLGARQPSLLAKVGALLRVAVVTALSFAVIWSPFIAHGLPAVGQVLHRLFPLGRGLYEDKVANVWCALSVVVKLRDVASAATLAKYSAALVLACVLPSCAMLLYCPTKRQFRHSLVVVSLVFFLCSFQVHEKSILLVAMPVLLLLEEHRLQCASFLITSTISLFPLCIKDDTSLAFFALLMLYYVMLTDCLGLHSTETMFTLAKYHLSHMVGVLLCVAALLLPPPIRYPDVHALANSVFCCCLFLMHLTGFYALQLVDFITTVQADNKKLKSN